MIRQQEYGAGEVVLAEGELGTGFCILESGSLEVIRDGKVISEIDMAGAIFGELSELLSLKRDAVIRAKTDSRVRHIEENIASICEKNPKVALKLMRTLGRRLYRMNRLAVRGDSQNDHLRSADELQEEDGGAAGASGLRGGAFLVHGDFRLPGASCVEHFPHFVFLFIFVAAAPHTVPRCCFNRDRKGRQTEHTRSDGNMKSMLKRIRRSMDAIFAQ